MPFFCLAPDWDWLDTGIVGVVDDVDVSPKSMVEILASVEP
jgi:hypothetical protein